MDGWMIPIECQMPPRWFLMVDDEKTTNDDRLVQLFVCQPTHRWLGTKEQMDVFQLWEKIEENRGIRSSDRWMMYVAYYTCRSISVVSTSSQKVKHQKFLFCNSPKVIFSLHAWCCWRTATRCNVAASLKIMLFKGKKRSNFLLAETFELSAIAETSVETQYSVYCKLSAMTFCCGRKFDFFQEINYLMSTALCQKAPSCRCSCAFNLLNEKSKLNWNLTA